MPNILITNDDGIHAPGLRALAAAMQEIGTVTVVAPSHERSAAAQSLTLRQPIYCDQIADREYAIEGTPADAMIVALHTLLKEKPDLVVSGINPGANMGENIFYSGTVGAAMEAAINHVPAMAVSIAYRGKDFDFSVAAEFTRTACADRDEGRVAARRPAEREHSAAVDGEGAVHAAIVKDHAQPAATRHRSSRAAILLAARADNSSSRWSKARITPRFATAPFRSRRSMLDHTHTRFAESPFALGKNTGRIIPPLTIGRRRFEE